MPKGAVSKDGKRKKAAPGFQPGWVLDSDGGRRKIPDLKSMPLSYTVGVAQERPHLSRGLVTVVFSVPDVRSWSTTVSLDDVDNARLVQTLVRTLAIEYAYKAYGLRHVQTNRRPQERDIVKAVIAHWTGQTDAWAPAMAELHNIMVAAVVMGS